MNADELKQRTKRFSLAVIKLVEELATSQTASVLGRQLLRSGTSVGANYLSATRARSAADFVSKIGIALEEAEESRYWLELLQSSRTARHEQLHDLISECTEFISIFTSSSKTVQSRYPRKKA